MHTLFLEHFFGLMVLFWAIYLLNVAFLWNIVLMKKQHQANKLLKKATSSKKKQIFHKFSLRTCNPWCSRRSTLGNILRPRRHLGQWFSSIHGYPGRPDSLCSQPKLSCFDQWASKCWQWKHIWAWNQIWFVIACSSVFLLEIAFLSDSLTLCCFLLCTRITMENS